MPKRTFGILVVLLAARLLPAAEKPGFRKPYFGLTRPGAWAKYTMKMPGFPDSFMTYTRLPDAEGRPRLTIRADFTTEGQASTSFTDYELQKGYVLEKDALDFGRAVVSMTVRTSGGEPMKMEAAVLENVRQSMPNYAPAVRFVASETVEGRPCDHYKYTSKHPGDPVQIETGELWLSDEVPFGLVRQAGITKDPSGKVISQYEMFLSESGAGASGAEADPPAEARLALADAYRKEKVQISIEVLAEPKDGSRLRVTFRNKTEAPVRLTIPAGATDVEVGTPIGTLHLVAAAEKSVDLAPGQTSLPFDFTQTGNYRAVEGRFTASVYEGTPLFSGSVTMDRPASTKP